MVTTGKQYFLSRPRRFGKSLLLNTIAALFKGHHDTGAPPEGYFAELWIGKSDYDFTQTYPVIELSMDLDSESPELLREDLKEMVRRTADSLELTITGNSPGGLLSDLILKLNRESGKQVVLLVDEFDSPVSDHVDDIELAKKNRNILKYFYSKLKSSQSLLRFVFVTGVTHFAFMGLSSGLNQLIDLTLNANYSGICGFTPEELDIYFKEHLAVTIEIMKKNRDISQKATMSDLLDEIRKWYDGYSWDGEVRVLNPCSILNFINESLFSNYWIGAYPSMTFLSKYSSRNPLSIIQEEFIPISDIELNTAEVGKLKPVPTLFQTGFLTVKERIRASSSGKAYSLKIPNWEIQCCNYDALLGTLFQLLDWDSNTALLRLKGAILERDAQKLTEIFNSLFGGLPSEHHQENESCYHKMVYSYCRALTDMSLPERKGAIGNSDLIAVYFNENVYAIFELKFGLAKIDTGAARSRRDSVESEKTKTEDKINRLLEQLAKEALKAIENKEYWTPFHTGANKIIKIGVGVTRRGKCLVLIG
jgi:hypothetical protein